MELAEPLKATRSIDRQKKMLQIKMSHQMQIKMNMNQLMNEPIDMG